MHNKSMRSDDGAPTAKKDLRKLETSIKEDLKRYAAKDDLVRELALASTRLELKMDSWAERIEANNERFRSQMTTWVTALEARRAL